MRLTSSDKEKLARLALHDGWEVFVRVLESRIRAEQNTLNSHKFDQLLEVGRSQGAIHALERAVSFVERRLEKVRED